MSEREDNVYKAKLAEQAERYDGEWIFFWVREPAWAKMEIDKIGRRVDCSRVSHIKPAHSTV